MKRTFLFLTCLIASLAMSIQLHAVTIENGYHKMLVEGKVWNYTHHTVEGDRPFYVEVKGDTMIDGNACKKVYVCMANSRQLYGSYYEYGNSVNAYLASDFKKNDGRWSLVEQPAGSASKDLYEFMVTGGTFGGGYYFGTNTTFTIMGYIATRRAGITSADDACNWPSEVFPTCYDLVKTSTGIWGRAQLTYYRQLTPVETWVSGIGDSKWGILQPHHDAWQEGDESIEFESCSQDGQILFTKADFDAEALKADYKPFVEENKRWTCWRNPYGADLYYFYLKGDTIVDGRTCKKLYSQNEHNDGLTRYEGALYEQDRRVYRYLPGQTTAYSYFDFSLKPGEESEPMDSSPTFTQYINMTSNLYELRDGQLYRMIAFVIRRGSRYDNMGVWIEGVGPGYMLDLSNHLEFYVMGDGYGDGIIDCSVNGQSVYRTDRYSSVVGDDDHLDDYLPFVELGKKWNVVSSSNPDNGYNHEYYMMTKEVERNGKTYVQTNLRNDVLCKEEEVGLFREENRRVYQYDETAGRDIMLYDFSLKEGDTFTYEYGFDQPVNCKVLKQGSLTDGPKIVSLCTPVSGDSLNIEYRWLRTWTIGRDNGAGGYEEFATWEECIGGLKNVFSPNNEKNSYLAYVERTDHETDYNKNEYLPFSFHEALGQIHGCDLPTGAVTNWEDYNHQLTYELEGNNLHIYGSAFTNCGRNNYAFFHEEKTTDPLVHRIKFQIQAVEPVATCMALHATNFYVPGFDPNMNYIVADDQGVEHPVINKTPQTAYRPMIEDGKVWKVGDITSGNPAQCVEHFYFDGDTIIDGKTCKQMMCQRYVNPDFHFEQPALYYVGAWYEEDQKVYFHDSTNNLFKLMYDFSIDANDTIKIDNQSYVIGPKQTGGMKGFKGVYRDVRLWADGGSIYSVPWLEGVGGIDRPTTNVYPGNVDPLWALMSCTVGDEVIYFNDDYEDGATPESAEARKRIDFTHTIKIKPKSRRTIDVESLLYGEYNDLQLGINLNALDDAYLVHIADETGKTVYEKTVNAGNVVGLNIDISTYPKGRYTITVENSSETFTGRFETQPNGIEEVRSKSLETRGAIYNLQGQRLDTLQKGLNIVNGKKVIAK